MAAPRIQLIIKESNINIEKNSSTITATLYYYGNGETWNETAPCAISIGGHTKSFEYNIRPNTNGIIGSYSVTFNHNTDGSLKVAYGASVSASQHYGPTTTSGQYTCKTIARATEPKLSAKTPFHYGESLTINLSPASNNFQHRIMYSVSQGLQDLVTLKPGVNSYTWMPPKNLVKHTPDYAGRTMLIRVYTISNGTEVGYKEATIIIYPSSDMTPTVSISLSDPTKLKDNYGGFVIGQSKIEATLTETQYLGSPIKSRSIVIDGNKYTDKTTATTTSAVTSKKPVTATITDRRDMIGKASVTPTYIDWYQPKITSLKVQRCNANGTINETGDYVRIDYAINIAPLGSKKPNSRSLKISLKKQTEQNYGTTNSVPLDGYNFQSHATYPASGNNAYDVHVELKDDFATTTLDKQIGTAFVLINWRNTGRGIAIGKVSEKDAFEVDMFAEFGKTVTVEGKELVKSGGVKGENGGHKMALSWDGSHVIAGVDNNAAVKTLVDASMIDVTSTGWDDGSWVSNNFITDGSKPWIHQFKREGQVVTVVVDLTLKYQLNTSKAWLGMYKIPTQFKPTHLWKCMQLSEQNKRYFLEMLEDGTNGLNIKIQPLETMEAGDRMRVTFTYML